MREKQLELHYMLCALHVIEPRFLGHQLSGKKKKSPLFHLVGLNSVVVLCRGFICWHLTFWVILRIPRCLILTTVCIREFINKS